MRLVCWRRLSKQSGMLDGDQGNGRVEGAVVLLDIECAKAEFIRRAVPRYSSNVK